ncbi:hypothetical protein [Demequina aestuarii]|uniref:hypothetical protein n=1 Tax=Demequina aestuarii TaxID=327095 RepID=UPI000782F8CA|nr:hypothetical protein [Demequina aestuarii]
MAGVRWATSAIVCAIALASCDGSPATPSPSPSAGVSPPPVAAVGGTAFPRTLQADRLVEVQVETPGDERGIVVSVALDSPYFGQSGTVPTNVLLEPGWIARLRVPLGPALCPAGSGSSVATVEVRAYEGVDVAEREVTLEDSALRDINTTECRQRLATDAAAPSFATEPVVSGDALQTSVVLQRGSSRAEATLTALSGNVIFALEPADGSIPVTLEAGQERTAVPVTIRASRCDAHALAESKKTFVFTASYDVGGESVTVEYRAEGATQEALQALVDQCAARSESDGIGGQR